MATHAPITGAPTRAPFIPAPPAAITRTLARFDRNQLAGFVAVAIDLLDLADGDPDLEPNGDELDGNRAEDDFIRHEPAGPGCPIADPDMSIEDAGHPGEIADRTYAEWHTLSAVQRRAGLIDGKPLDPFYATLDEDHEDDDSAEEDDAPEDEHDREQVNEDGPGELYTTLPRYGIDQSLGPINERDAMTEHYRLAREGR